jgi:hypothetical protein
VNESKGSKVRFFFGKNRFGAFFWGGVALLVLGIGIFSYANSVVQALEQSLQGNLTTIERDRISGSLAWWRIALITTYDPLSLVFIVVGVFCILYACGWASMQPTSKEST